MNVRRVIDESLRKVQALKSYRCVMELYSEENVERRARQRYLYRAPGDIRIEQIGPFRKGAVVVVRSDGRIRAHAGGLLSFFKVDLHKDSELIRGIAGGSAVESDWKSIILKSKKRAPFVVKARSSPIKVDSEHGYEVITILKNLPYNQVRFILREDGPIVLLERFQNRKLRNRVEWKDIELNPELVDADFEL